MNKISNSVLWNIYNNAIHMIKERNYKIGEYITSFKIFNLAIKNKDFIIIKCEYLTKNINVILYFKENVFRENDMKSIINNTTSKIKHLILIIDASITSRILKKKEKYPNLKIEFIGHNIFYIHITKHWLVPKHILLNKKEMVSLYNTSITTNTLNILDSNEDFYKNAIKYNQNMRKIFNTDSISMWYGAQPGNIFKIIRNSGKWPGLNQISYSLVIDSKYIDYKKK